MAHTNIADLIPDGDVRVKVNTWIRQEAVRLAKFRQAGLVQANAVLNERLANAGDVTSFPYYNPLAGDSVVGTDAMTDVITIGNVSGGELLAARQNRVKAWGGADLAKLTTGFDPIEAIVGGVAEWLALDEQKIFMATLNGVIADMASGGDKDAFIIGDGTTKIDGAMLEDARQLKGERKDMLTTLVVHSKVESQLIKDNKISYDAPNEQGQRIKRFGDFRVEVSDAMPVASGVYTSVLVSPGIFSHGDHDLGGDAIATVRNELGGNGFGGEALVFRRVFGTIVNGYSYVGEARPDNTELASADSWTRKYAPELIGISVIKSDLS